MGQIWSTCTPPPQLYQARFFKHWVPLNMKSSGNSKNIGLRYPFGSNVGPHPQNAKFSNVLLSQRISEVRVNLVICITLGLLHIFVVFGATVCKTVRPMLSDRCLSVCLSCLSVCLTRRQSPSNPWFTPALHAFRSTVRHAEDLWKHTHSAVDWSSFKSLRNKYHNLIFAARRNATTPSSSPHLSATPNSSGSTRVKSRCIGLPCSLCVG